MQGSPPARRLVLDGVRNLRDLGGYATDDGRVTRWRTLYRSDCPDRLSLADQEWLIGIGVRTMIDLRDHDEVRRRRKDRTGIVVGLLLGVLGVPLQTIAQDYALSASCLGEEYLVDSRQWALANGIDWERWGHLWDTSAARMLNTLQHVARQHGSAPAYLERHGLRPGALDQLRELLTTPAA